MAASGDQLRMAARNMRAAADARMNQVQQAERRITDVRAELANLQNTITGWRRDAQRMQDQVRYLEQQAVNADREEQKLQQLANAERQTSQLTNGQ